MKPDAVAAAGQVAGAPVTDQVAPAPSATEAKQDGSAARSDGESDGVSCGCSGCSLQRMFDCPCLHSIIGAPVPTGPGRYPLKVRSMDLNDELGQITHIFSDKTGTLTLNKMEFRSIMVGSVTYGVGSASLRKALAAAGRALDDQDTGSIRTDCESADASAAAKPSSEGRGRHGS